MTDSRLAKAWARASELLRLDTVAPYSVELPSGARINATVLVREFGAPNGMLIVTDYSHVRGELAALEAAGYGFSVLEEPDPTDSFEVEEYAEMLRDWGWAGMHGEQPSWFASS